jgi:hypothetical protein
MAETEKPIIAEPPVVACWLASFLILGTLGGMIALLWGLSTRNWIGPGIMIIMLVAVMGLAVLTSGNGVIAEKDVLVFYRIWWPSKRWQIGWMDVMAVELKFDRRFGPKSSYLARLTIRYEDKTYKIACPWNVDLLRAVVSRAQLNLQRGPDQWQTRVEDSDDPFQVVKQGRPRKQRWLWTRS